MARKYLMPVLLIALALAPVKVCFARTQRQGPRNSIGAGVRYNDHVEMDEIENAEFDDSYLSYVVGFRYEPNYMWIVDAVLDYYPSGDDISYILSPRISLLRGHGFCYGMGIEWKYVKLESGESDWSDETYLVQAGFEMPMAGDNMLHIDAYYGLEEFSDSFEIISDFDSDRLTFGLRFYHYF